MNVPGSAGVCTVFVRHIPDSGVLRRSHVAVLSNLARVQPASYHSLVPWTQSRFSLEIPAMPGFESSSLDGQTPGRLQFFNESATPPRVPRSIALMNQEIAIRYVLVLTSQSYFRSHHLSRLNLNLRWRFGWPILICDG
jgi:hypothetical protein